MKKIITFSVVLVLFLSSCSVDWDDSNSDFKKKAECSSYREKMIDFADEKIYGNKDSFNIEEIFYSSKGNSCYFIASYYSLGNELQEVIRYQLFDFMAGKSIAIRMNCNELKNCTEKGEKEDENYDRKIKELKGE